MSKMLLAELMKPRSIKPPECKPGDPRLAIHSTILKEDKELAKDMLMALKAQIAATNCYTRSSK